MNFDGVLMLLYDCVCVSEFPCKYSFQERALVAFKPRPILFIMNKICLNQTNIEMFSTIVPA